MADMEAKIAEIIAKEAWVKTPDQMAKEIAALIAADRAEALDDAYDKGYGDGFGIGKTEGGILASRDRAGLVEALELAKKQILHMEECFQPNERLGTTEKVLAKIDSALKEMGK